jgi:hypothetical protein
MAMVLLGAGCAMTTVGRVGTANAQGQPVDNPPSEVSVETAGAAPDQPGVVVTAHSPTAVRFQPDAGDTVIPLTPIHPHAPARHRLSPATYGLLIGVLGGAALGSANDHDPRVLMDPDSCRCSVIPSAVIFGLIGLGVGAAVGAIWPGDNP